MDKFNDMGELFEEEKSSLEGTQKVEKSKYETTNNIFLFIVCTCACAYLYLTGQVMWVVNVGLLSFGVFPVLYAICRITIWILEKRAKKR